ncbi:MAG: UDP-N-acetylglucosamine 1-carboxyvinyltransferase [bacterium]
MDKIVIKGGKKLKGVVAVSGSKNATLPVIAAAILGSSPSTIKNIPLVRDIRTMAKLIGLLGAKSEIKEHTLTIDPAGIKNYEAPYELVKTMRASIYVLGPLLTKYGYAKVSLPGGCAIGARPINLHLMGMKKMGAKIEIAHGFVKATAKKLKGARIVFDKVSVGATINVMLAAVLADGETRLENVAKEPDVVGAVEFLKLMGAQITGEGTDVITIKGVKKLHGVKDFSVMPDRIEAATLISAAVMTKGAVKITHLIPAQLALFLEKIKEAGVKIKTDKNSVTVFPYKGKLKATDIITAPYPGFPTDVQAQWMALMTLAKGEAVIKEEIWENRFMHVMELTRMGSDIRVDGNMAIIKGVNKLSAANVMASDLRAGAALIIAALAADGVSEVHRIYHIERGYEGLDKKLKSIGANIYIEKDGN